MGAGLVPEISMETIIVGVSMVDACFMILEWSVWGLKAPYNTRLHLVLYGPLDPTLCALLLIQHSCSCFNYLHNITKPSGITGNVVIETIGNYSCLMSNSANSAPRID